MDVQRKEVFVKAVAAESRWKQTILPISLTFGRHCSYHTITGRLQIQTRASSQTFWVAGVWRLVWTARALDRLLIRCSAPNMEDIVIGRAHRRFRVFVVRCCVTAELVDFDCDSRTDGLVYMAALFIHFRPSFLEFLRLSKTSQQNSQETLKARNTHGQ